MRFLEGTLVVAYLFHISGALHLASSTAFNKNQPCTSNVGQCKALNDCPAIQKDILKEIMGGTSIIELLRNTSCGVVGGKPHFCCPLSEETTTEASIPMEHPSLQLLPRDICGVDFSDKILGGKEAKLKQFPWMALLQVEKDPVPKIICGGSLVSEYYILTAAHCISNDYEKRHISVCLGEHDILTDPDCDGIICSDMLQTFAIDEFIRHPQYDKKRKSGDIALIRLNKKAVFTEYVYPICLPSLETRNRHFLERSFIVAGWGATEIEISSDVKQWLRVPVVNNSRCAETLHVTMDDTFMCAGTVEGEATCIGDSGGPLMMVESVIHYRPGEQWVVVAIVQGGTWVCGTKGVPGLYTRVEPYIDWILDNIRP